MPISKLEEHNLLVNNTQEISEITTTLSNSNSQLPTSGAVKRLLDHITLDTFIVGGEWTNRQYSNLTPDPTGLEFIAVYRDGHRANVVANLEAPDVWSNQAGMQIATFSYTENGTTVRALKAAGIDLTPLTLTVNGSWSKPQFYQNAPDISGLSFTITYNNNQSSTTQSVAVSPSVWPSISVTPDDQTATFSYTENGITITTTKDATVVAKPVSLTISGSWSNPQFYYTAPDPTGLVFTVGYNDGTSSVKTASNITISPSVWNDVGTRTATFSYTENGITVSATKNATVIKKLSSLVVGGSWTNYQFANEAPDTTGLTYVAYYNDNSSAGANATCTTSTWANIAGTQSAEFSYTENGITVTAYYDANVAKRLKSLSYSGTWPTEREGQIVSTYGITFTATYMDDSTKTVTPTTISPETWATGTGSQTATFTYTESGVTISTTKTIGMTYDITYGTATGGSASGPTTYVYSASSQTKTISYSPDQYYEFVNWTVSGGGSASGTTLTINAGNIGTITATPNFQTTYIAVPINKKIYVLSTPTNLYTDMACTTTISTGYKNSPTFYKRRGTTYSIYYLSYNGTGNWYSGAMTRARYGYFYDQGILKPFIKNIFGISRDDYLANYRFWTNESERVDWGDEYEEWHTLYYYCYINPGDRVIGPRTHIDPDDYSVEELISSYSTDSPSPSYYLMSEITATG